MSLLSIYFCLPGLRKGMEQRGSNAEDQFVSVFLFPAYKVQILNGVPYILHSTYTLGKVIDPSIFPPAMGK